MLAFCANFRSVAVRGATCLVLALSAITVASADWNQWRGPDRDGSVNGSPPLIEQIPDGGLEPVWRSEGVPSGFRGGWSSPVVANGRVYLFVHSKDLPEGATEVPKREYPWLPPDKRGHLSEEEYRQYEINRRNEDEAIGKLYNFREVIHCLDLKTGETIWTNDRPSIYTRFLHSGTPTVLDGRLYVLCPGRVARCFDADNGTILWETRLPGDFRDEYMMSSFAVADGAAVVLAGRLFGLDADTGDLLWAGDEDATRGTHSSPVVWRAADNGTDRALMIANVSGGDTICFEPQTGRELWRVESEAVLSTPLVAGDRLITYGNSRKKGLRCYEISPAGAELKWTFQRVADKGSSPVIVDGHVYVQGEKRVACVELESGRGRWTALLDLESPQYTSLVAADGKLLYGYGGLLLFAATPERYTPLVEGRFDVDKQLASDTMLREKHAIGEIAASEGGQQKAEQVYQQKIGKHRPLRCATPALADGLVIVRFDDGLACYDLRAEAAE